MKPKMDCYKQAPTWLFNMNDESKLFTAQNEVDDAWKKGWFGPKSLAAAAPLLSNIKWERKLDLTEAIRGDIRYRDFVINPRLNFKQVMEKIIIFEQKQTMEGVAEEQERRQQSTQIKPKVTIEE